MFIFLPGEASTGVCCSSYFTKHCHLGWCTLVLKCNKNNYDTQTEPCQSLRIHVQNNKVYQVLLKRIKIQASRLNPFGSVRCFNWSPSLFGHENYWGDTHYVSEQQLHTWACCLFHGLYSCSGNYWQMLINSMAQRGIKPVVWQGFLCPCPSGATGLQRLGRQGHVDPPGTMGRKKANIWVYGLITHDKSAHPVMH